MFLKLFQRFYDSIGNNLGKTLILGNTTLFLGCDSCIFRKQTSPQTARDSVKYNNNSIYSQFMRPIRNIKDCFWINHIHMMLLTNNERTCMNRENYSKFLSHFPYQEEIYNNLTDYSVKVSKKWLIDEFNYLNISPHANHQKLCNILGAFSMKKFSKEDKTFARELLRSELDKDILTRNNSHILWCFREAFEHNKDILSIHSVYLDTCDDWFFIPENLDRQIYTLSDFKCKRPLSYFNEISEKYYFPRSLIFNLLSNEYYLSRLNKIKPNHLTLYLNDCAYYFKYEHLFEFSEIPDYLATCHFIDSVSSNTTLKNIILNNFHDLDLAIKMRVISVIMEKLTTRMRVISATMKNTNTDTVIENKIIFDFFKNNDDNIQNYITKYNSPYSLRAVKDTVIEYKIISEFFKDNDDNIQNYITKYNSTISLQTLTEMLSQFTNITNVTEYVTSLVVSGKYQITKHEQIPEYMLQDSNIEKILINQHKLDIDQVKQLVNKYEKLNRHLTPTELIIFLKKYQPEFVKHLYS
jgi:hypothetical protein